MDSTRAAFLSVLSLRRSLGLGNRALRIILTWGMHESQPITNKEWVEGGSFPEERFLSWRKGKDGKWLRIIGPLLWTSFWNQ